MLIWNERLLDSTVFLRAYEDLLLRYGTDYEKVRHENVTAEIAEFFSPGSFELRLLKTRSILILSHQGPAAILVIRAG